MGLKGHLLPGSQPVDPTPRLRPRCVAPLSWVRGAAGFPLFRWPATQRRSAGPPGKGGSAGLPAYHHLKHTSVPLGNEPQIEGAGPGGRGGAFLDPPLGATPRGVLADSASRHPSLGVGVGLPQFP